MKKGMKRATSILAACMFLLTLFPMQAFAEYSTTITIEVSNVQTPTAGEYCELTHKLSVKRNGTAETISSLPSYEYWEDVNSAKTLTEDDTFMPQRQYKLHIVFKLAEPAVYVNINVIKPWNAVEVQNVRQYGTEKMYVEFDIIYNSHTVLGDWNNSTESYDPELDGFDMPYYGGDKPDFNFGPVASQSSLFSISNISWYPKGQPSNKLTATSSFTAGVTYVCEFKATAGKDVTFHQDVEFVSGWDQEVTLDTTKKVATVKIFSDPLMRKVTSVTIQGITAPVYGQAPTVSGISTNSTFVQLGTPSWKGTFNGGTFDYGQTYTLVIPYDVASNCADFLEASGVIVNAGTPSIRRYEVGAPEIQVTFTLPYPSGAKDAGTFTFDLSQGSSFIRYTTSETHPEAVGYTFAALLAEEAVRIDQADQYYDLDNDGTWDMFVESGVGIVTYTPLITSSIGGTYTLTVGTTGYNAIKDKDIWYYSTLIFKFPEFSAPTDLGTRTFDLALSGVSVSSGDQEYTACLESLKALAHVIETKVQGNDTYLDIDGNGRFDIKYSVTAAGGITIDLAEDCILGGTNSVKMNKSAVMAMQSSGVKKYYSTLNFCLKERPAATTNLKATAAGKNRVKLTWNKVAGAEGYLVYAQKNGKYAYVGMTSSPNTTTFTDTKALDTDFNYYWVFAYVKNHVGKMVPGASDKYKFAKGICPAVTGLKASSSTGRVILTWSKVEGADGYLIYGIHPGEGYKYLGMASGTSWYDAKASKTDWNFYWVFPYHQGGGGQKVAGLPPAKYVYSKAR